jgi:hypothetical protein
MAGWRLKKEVRVCPTREEKEGVKKEVPASTVGPCPPFYKTREAGYMSGERKREVGSVHAQHVYGWKKLAAWLLMSSPGAMPHACS